jgi:hypothetical protein
VVLCRECREAGVHEDSGHKTWLDTCTDHTLHVAVAGGLAEAIVSDGWAVAAHRGDVGWVRVDAVGVVY